MPDLVIPDGYGQCALKWSFVGKTNPVTTTLGASTLVGASSPQEVVDEIFTNCTDNNTLPCFATNMTPSWTFIGVEGVFNVGGVMIGAASAASPIVGTHSAAATPTLNTSMIIRKRTTLVGRKFRGRMYWPALLLDEGAVDPMGTISSGFFGAYDTIITALDSELTNGTVYTPRILHTDSGVPPTLITSFALQSHVVTQRRRMRN